MTRDKLLLDQFLSGTSVKSLGHALVNDGVVTAEFASTAVEDILRCQIDARANRVNDLVGSLEHDARDVFDQIRRINGTKIDRVV